MTEDDPRQAALARAAFSRAEEVVIATPALCELVWVLSRSYRLGRSRIADAITALTKVRNVVLDRGEVDAGLAALAAGGDFADGVIALEGSRHDGAAFLSFDRAAVKLLAAQGRAARLLS